MPLVVTLRFPHGRYHATPWGRQVNEGRPEWPPSPWRLARALLASWHRHGGPGEAAELQSALQLLGSPVTFHVPRTGRGHARHYFPLATRSKKAVRDDTTLGMDPFVTVHPSHVCLLVFDCEPNESEVQLLAKLAARVGYLGRGESLVDIEVTDVVDASMRDGTESIRADAQLSVGDDVERLLCPAPDVTLDHLRVTSADLRDHGGRKPEGSRELVVAYDPLPGGGSASPRTPARSPGKPTLVVLALSGRPLPRLGDAVVVAEQVRQRARKHHAESVAFTGRAAGSIELDHAHAYWVPLPERMLPSPAGIPASRIAVWCREGFDDAEIRALVDVRELVWGRPEDDKPARSYARRVLGDSVVASPEYLGAPDRERWAIFGRSTTWVSLTPFTTNRHQKRHQSDHAFLEDSVRRHLRHVALPHSPEEVTVEITDFAAKGFRAHRHPGARTPTGGIHRRAHVRLGFDSAVDGPVLLGSLSHFGLGTFVPEEI